MGVRLRSSVMLLIAVLLPLAHPLGSPVVSGTGALVLWVPPPGEGLSLQTGDLITAWLRLPEGEGSAASGPVAHPMDLLVALLEEQPRGTFQVSVSRGAGEVLWVPWPTTPPRPELGLAWTDDRREAERQAVALLRQKDPKGIDQMEALALGPDLSGRERAWLLYAAARGARSLALGDRGAALAGQAEGALVSGPPAELAMVLDLQGILTEQKGELDAAAVLYRRGLESRGGAAAQTLGAAKSLTSIGRVAWTRGNLPAAREQFTAALALRSLLAPGSMDEADSLNDLGIIAWRLADLDGAEGFLRRCLAIQERLVPDGVDAARTWNNLGLVAYDRGDLSVAEECFHRSLVVRERLIPKHPDTAQCLQNLGVICWKRGDLTASESYYRRGLDLERSLAPRSLGVAHSLHSLGVLLLERADVAGGGDYLRQAQALYEEVAPGSIDVAQGLNALASLAEAEGDLESADRDLSRALALHRAQAPGSPLEAKALVNLGLLRRLQGRPSEARQALESAIAIWDKVAPGSPERARAVLELGRLLDEGGEVASGEARIREALAEYHRLLPGAMEEAEAAHALGTSLVRQGKPAEGIPHLMAALVALEADTRRAGESEHDRAGFRSKHARMYEDAVAALVDAGRPQDAFCVLERSRAREFLVVLSERDLNFGAEIPAELDRDRRRLAARHDALREELAETPAGGPGRRREEILQELRDLARRRDEIAASVRRASPHVAGLTDPKPLDRAAASAALDRGTLFLSYAVGEARSFLFVLGPGSKPFGVFELPVTRTTLSAQVRRFRSGLLSHGEVARESEVLGRVLLGPATEALRRSRSIVISPDGPLFGLPFAALRVPVGPGRAVRYLAEAKPLTTVASATVYAELSKRPSSQGQRVLALGDPDYGTGASTDGSRSPSGPGGGKWPPLPFSRAEVSGISLGFGPLAEVRLGREATEGRIRAASGTPLASVHLACHAFTDDLFPLDSGLALALPLRPGDGDGVLRAWEIIESLRLDTDRVVLSACDTGLGREVRGEGIVGLVRAFHFSGAPTVVSTLWGVSDLGTSRLMERFYRHLRAGAPALASLRKAQAELLRGEAGAEWTHPFYWAAFQVSGDGR